MLGTVAVDSIKGVLSVILHTRHRLVFPGRPIDPTRSLPVLPALHHTRTRARLTQHKAQQTLPRGDSPTRRPTHHSHTRHDRPQDGTSTPGTLTALSRSQLTVTTHLHFSHTPAPSVCAAPRRHMQTPHRVPCPRCTRTQRPSVRHTTHPAHVKRRHYRLEDSCHSTHTVCLCTVIADAGVPLHMIVAPKTRTTTHTITHTLDITQ